MRKFEIKEFLMRKLKKFNAIVIEINNGNSNKIN